MPTYQIYNRVTGELVRTETMDDEKLRPMVPEGCGLRLAPEPSPEPPAPVEAPAPPAEPESPSQPDPGATAMHEGA